MRLFGTECVVEIIFVPRHHIFYMKNLAKGIKPLHRIVKTLVKGIVSFDHEGIDVMKNSHEEEKVIP